MKDAAPPTASVGAVHETVPEAPAAGAEQAQPAAEVRDWNVVPAGVGSLS